MTSVRSCRSCRESTSPSASRSPIVSITCCRGVVRTWPSRFLVDLGSVVEDVQNAVGTRVTLPTGYRIEYSGQFESSEQAASLLLWLSIAVVIAMFFILAAAFGSGGLAGLIMVNLPLALIGGIAGVFVSGGVLSIASIIGLIALLGIAARNGIMLVSHIEYLRHEEGVTDLRHGVVQGSIDRVVPILMAALCTGPGARAHCARRPRARERDSGADGGRYYLRPDLFDRAQHAGGSGGVLCGSRGARGKAFMKQFTRRTGRNGGPDALPHGRPTPSLSGVDHWLERCPPPPVDGRSPAVTPAPI